MSARVRAPAIGMIHEVRLQVFCQSRVVAPRIRSLERAHMRTVQRVRRPERYHILSVVEAGVVALRPRACIQYFVAAAFNRTWKLQPILVQRRLSAAGECEKLRPAGPECIGLRGVLSATVYRGACLIDISLAGSKVCQSGAERAAHKTVRACRR